MSSKGVEFVRIVQMMLLIALHIMCVFVRSSFIPGYETSLTITSVGNENILKVQTESSGSPIIVHKNGKMRQGAAASLGLLLYTYKSFSLILNIPVAAVFT